MLQPTFYTQGKLQMIAHVGLDPGQKNCQHIESKIFMINPDSLLF